MGKTGKGLKRNVRTKSIDIVGYHDRMTIKRPRKKHPSIRIEEAQTYV